MNKFALIALTLGMLQLAFATDIQCDKTGLANCRMEIGKALDEDIKNAHITMIKVIVRMNIDAFRELRKKCAPKPDCTDTIDQVVRDLKDDMEKLDEQKDDMRAQQEIVRRMMTNLKEETLNSAATGNEIKKITEHVHLKAPLDNPMRDLINEIVWLLKETSIELREKDIKMDDIEQSIDEMKDAMKSNKDDDEKVKEVAEILWKMTETIEMPWTKEMLMGMEKLEMI